MTRFHHIGLTVPDLAGAIGFFTEVLDFTLLFTMPPGGVVADDYAAAVRIPPGTESRGLAVLRKGDARLELFEYAGDDQCRDYPSNHDVGGHHLAFEVDDLEAALARLLAAGGQQCGPVRTARVADFRGMQWTYVTAPFGLQLELVCFPDGSF
jgi:catechol 2,3-dioxygenase-like lactoylglutathione lyase family enzyme